MKSTVVLVVGLFFGFKAIGQSTFQFNNTLIAPGTKKHFLIPIGDQPNQTQIPITVFHGKNIGPVLGITAGVHGYEYAPILAGQKLIQTIDPETLSGTIILVQIANLASFLGRSPYVNPLDDKNLNRSFPGDAQGSVTERIADFISQQIIPRCNFFLDIHSGDAPEDLMPYSAYYQHDDFPGRSHQGKLMAQIMGFDHIVVFKTTEKGYMQKDEPSLYCSAQAFKSGIPAVDIECGKLGMIEPELVAKIVSGVEQLMQHLRMNAGVPETSPGALFIEERTYLNSAHTGVFYPLKSSGDYITKGMKIGCITDFFHRTLEEIYAPETGIILYMLGTPPVNKGETIIAIGKVDDETTKP